MYNSNITVKSIIDKIKSEEDVSEVFSDDYYILWYNACEQLLYSEIIKEQALAAITVSSGVADMPSVDNLQDNIRFEDIYKAYGVDGTNYIELEKTNISGGLVASDINLFWNSGSQIGVKADSAFSALKIVYFVRPKLKTTSDIDTGGTACVSLPVEFVSIIMSKIRGEKYKLANQDDYAAKWLNDYNKGVEDLKVWIAARTANYEM